jgi:hypothetical protein
MASRRITVPDSDEEDTPPAPNKYARFTKTRVTSSGKVEGFTTSTVPIFEVEMADVHAPLEEDADVPANTSVEHVVPVVPAKKKKKRKKANDTVSRPVLWTLAAANDPPDQDFCFPQCAAHRARRNNRC